METRERPRELPVPADDGACDHLPGLEVPSVVLPSTSGRWVDLGALGPGRTVIYCYPMTGAEGTPAPEGWDAIPGARGCTPQTCSFRDHHAELRALGAGVFGLSTQNTAAQREMVERLNVPFEVLSDPELRFATALRLPTFMVDGMVFIKRLTLIVRDRRIEHVFYPVYPPEESATETVAWLAAHQ